MKLIIVMTALILNFTHATECFLDTPVELPFSFVRTDLVFNDVVLDKTPVFLTKEVFDPANDSLILIIREIMHEDKLIGMNGVAIEYGDQGHWLGDAFNVGGDVKFYYSEQNEGDFKISTTKTIISFDGYNEPYEVTTKTTIKTKGRRILGIELDYMHPISSENNSVTKFGTSNTCVKSMNLSSN